ncbi:MAG TPA: neutral/alkaline non-lysosomal ceramidase N-terminal domain-containing protein, partial [Lacipirellulaceae bacterium]|nr:neutral/alkaline non-lysosomal ceramidase N-terminal domain-containing protein [Lacipirellulaceae bacterium]
MRSWNFVLSIRCSLIVFAATLATAIITRGTIAAAPPEPTEYEVGLAKVDITPDTPIRLSGFASRLTESVGVREHIFARAMAVRTAADGEPAVLVTVDSLCIPAYIRDEIAHRLKSKKNIANERLAICSTHCHTTPMVSNALMTLFGRPIPPEHIEHIDRYTKELIDKIEQAALAALDDLKPARLAYGIGNVGFSINRRTKGGPVDHDLPVMSILAADGKVRGIWVDYACHCVVLSDFKVSGDWAGYAAEEIERQHPDAVALLSVGCGADSNPQSGVVFDKGEVAQGYGQEVATEVDRLLRSPMTTVTGPVICQLQTITLPLQRLPTREAWAERAKAATADGYYAKVQLAHLDAGEKLPTTVAYPVQTWKFGKSLAAVFLSGEVVVDYSLRLKKEFDASRLWMNAYANDDPAYIPSERVLKEGGYEGGGAMIYYGLPAPFAPGLEDKIIAAVSAQLGDDFKAPPAKQNGTQGSTPKSAAESLAAIKVHDGLRVELVASEPLVQSPVAIDFGPDGKLWVAEMRDYGCKDNEVCPPNGRVSVLEDRDSDGIYETSTVFLDKIAEPMGVKVWRKGVLISAAPDLIYAEDTDGDGKADVVQKLFTGFSVENPQARLNMLSVGLDGWLQAGCMFTGTIRNREGKEVGIGNRDFRLKPDDGVIDPENGQTENTRSRDDWGNWFGCQNSVVGFHYPISDRYLRRNSNLVPPRVDVPLPTAAASQLYPRGKLVLFELSGPAGRATSSCGITIYRDELLGSQFAGNSFTCEPVNQMVHRMVLKPKGATFVGERASDEADSEFLTSTDSWFRPVQARTGPDGALWVVDMYRYVIEHSRWIPKKTLDELDLHAGSNMGRIYRVLPKDAKAKSLPRLDKLSTAELAAAMDSPNGTLRDMIQLMLTWHNDESAIEPLVKIAENSSRPAARLQAICTLDLLGHLSDKQITKALRDPHPGVRRQAIRLAEARLKSSYSLTAAIEKLVNDRDPSVALQLACSLGETDDPSKVVTLAKVAQEYPSDAYITAGVMSSVNDAELGDLLKLVFGGSGKLPSTLVRKLMELAGTATNEHTVSIAVELAARRADDAKHKQFDALESLLAGLRRNP